MFIIYKITNKQNGLIYVGCTRRPLEKRLAEHFKRCIQQDDFHKAIKLYGVENFSVEIIEEGADDELVQAREKYWIQYFQSSNPEIGYNRTHGGNGTVGYIFTEEARKKISLAEMGHPVSAMTRHRIGNTWRGKHLPKEIREKISKARVGKYTGKENPFYGKRHSNETKMKIAVANSKSVRAIKLDSDEKYIFSSLTDASKFIQTMRGGLLSTIKSHISNSIYEINCKTAYGYKWEFIEKSNDYPDKE